MVKMTAGEFVEWLGDRDLAEGQFMGVLARDLEMDVRDMEGRMSPQEMADWSLLYDIEAEANRLKGG